MLPPVIVYHLMKPGTDCPDGIAAAWAAAKAFNFEVELVGEVYRKEEDWEGYEVPFDYVGRAVIFVDWAGYPSEIMAAIASEARSTTVIDHHKSAKGKYNTIADCYGHFKFYYVPNELGCGATAAWDYFHPACDRPWFLKYVRSRDTGMGGYWLGALPHHEAVNSLISDMRRGKRGQNAFEIFENLYLTTEKDWDIRAGVKGVELKNKLAKAEVSAWEESPNWICLSEEYAHLYSGEEQLYEAPYLEIQDQRADRHYSWVGTYLAQATNAPYVIVVTKGDRNTIHLRKPAHSTVDLAAIAAMFGGGGHESASGFQV